MNETHLAAHYSDDILAHACGPLADGASSLDRPGAWPEHQIDHLAECGFFRWLVPLELGGLQWSEADIIRTFLKLSATCLTTTFTLTQFTGGVRRLVAAENTDLREAWLPRLVDRNQTGDGGNFSPHDFSTASAKAGVGRAAGRGRIYVGRIQPVGDWSRVRRLCRGRSCPR